MSQSDITGLITAIAAIIAAIAGVAAAIIGTIALYKTSRAEKLRFALNRVEIPTVNVATTLSMIEISNPTKPIDKCRMLYNNVELNSNKTPRQQSVYVPKGGSVLFRIPSEYYDNNAEVVVKDGWHTLRKQR